MSESRKVVYAALVGNAAIAVAKFIAAGVSGSSAMLSEGVHSLVDTSNQLLLLYGMRRSSKPADRQHPFGYGRELYFWAFIVALLVFALGAGISFYEGIVHIRRPEPATHLGWNYGVLGVSMVFEGVTWVIALREFRRSKGAMGYFEAFRKSKDPTTFTVLIEDSAALLGLLFAFAGIAAASYFDLPMLDGVASLGIGALLTVAAVLLAKETKALLIGESADRDLSAGVLRIAESDSAVRRANGVLTVQMGPREVVAALSIEFEDSHYTPEVEAAIVRIERETRRQWPEVIALFVQPRTGDAWPPGARRGAAATDRTAGDELAGG